MVIWLFFSPFPRKIKRQKVLSSRNINSSVRVLFLSVTYPSISLFISFTCLITSLTRWNLVETSTWNNTSRWITFLQICLSLFPCLYLFPLILADKRVSSILEILFFIISFQRENHWFRISERVSCMCSTYRKLRKVRVRAWKRVGKSKGRGRTRITLFARCLSTSKGTFISTRVARHFLAFNGYPPVA